MSALSSSDYAVGIVQELRKLPAETEWVEFKHNNADPKEIGEYLVRGIEDDRCASASGSRRRTAPRPPA